MSPRRRLRIMTAATVVALLAAIVLVPAVLLDVDEVIRVAVYALVVSLAVFAVAAFVHVLGFIVARFHP